MSVEQQRLFHTLSFRRGSARSRPPARLWHRAEPRTAPAERSPPSRGSTYRAGSASPPGSGRLPAALLAFKKREKRVTSGGFLRFHSPRTSRNRVTDPARCDLGLSKAFLRENQKSWAPTANEPPTPPVPVPSRPVPVPSARCRPPLPAAPAPNPEGGREGGGPARRGGRDRALRRRLCSLNRRAVKRLCG